MIDRHELERREASQLQNYACFASSSKGRPYQQGQDDLRTCFQRDRGRIIHSAAFRRLEYKTQVFANHVGDHYRTRLTHSLEVAQIARTIASALGLNADLAEAIALSHDLGHPPYGHAGESCLQKLVADEGGFEHNLQSLRIVDILDHSYQEFPGLNLSFEVRASLWLHSHERADDKYTKEFAPLTQPPLEGQIVDLADSLAYTAHDLEDGLRSGIVEVDQLAELQLWHLISSAPETDFSGVTLQHRQRIGLLIDTLVLDLVEHSQKMIDGAKLSSWMDAATADSFLIAFSPAMQSKKSELNQFLYTHFYRHPEVDAISKFSEDIITSLFTFYLKNPESLPPFYRNLMSDTPLSRVCCDYIAGMTDRFAREMYHELF